jgi:hypothetical protein
MRAAAGWLLVLVGLCAGWAQGNTASVVGQVVDRSGRAVVGAAVTVRDTDLGAARTVVSDEHGAFRVGGLAPGAYGIEGKAQGLVLRRPLRVTLGLGSTVRVTLGLSVPVVEQKATVRARAATSEGNTVAPAVNKDEASVSSFFAGMTVTYLPNRDRDFTQFAQLGGGVTEDPDGNGLVVAGQRSSSVVTEVDGVEFNDALEGGRRGAGDGSFFLPQTVVREFQIVRSGVTADVAGTNAGLVNVATKEGSNKLHGEAFYTVRPSWAGSADAFGRGLTNRQNAFGGSLGGPVRKDKVFYYAGAEQDLLDVPSYVAFEGQGTPVPASLAGLEGQMLGRSTPTALFGRVDSTLNRSQTLNVEVAGNRVRATNIVGQDAGERSTRSIGSVDKADALGGQSVWARGGLTSVVNERSLNQATVAWSGDHRLLTPNSTAPETMINGFGVLGGDGLGTHRYTSRQLQVTDVFSLTRGGATLDVGAQFADSPAYEAQEANPDGRFDYDSLADYLAGRVRRFQQTIVTGAATYHGTVRQMGLFAEVKAPIGRNLTLTAGLRWDGEWNPQPEHPNAAIAQTAVIPNDLAQWQPRAGVAWTPGAKTVVRVSSGIYGAMTPATLFHRVSADNGLETAVVDSYFDPQVLGLVRPGKGLAGVPAGLTTPAALVVGIDPGFRNPRSLQAAAGVEQEVRPQLSLSAGYLHNSTWRLERRIDRNLDPPVSVTAGLPAFPATRPDPAIGRLLVEDSGGHASYDGLLLTAVSQLSPRSRLQVNYTISKTYDDDSNTGPYGIEAALDPFDLRVERAYSSLDVRQLLNVSAIFNLPWGLKANPLFVARSGRPYTPIIGFDTQGDANDWNDRALIGGVTAGRNSLRQPAFDDLDLRLVKDFTLPGAGHHLDLFMDVFNLGGAGNRNFGPEGVSLYGNSASPVASAGQALFAPDATRIGGARTIQFTARLVAF